MADTGSHSHGLTIWFTGLSGAGKSTLAREVIKELRSQDLRVQLLDADHVRTFLSPDLGFSRKDREENVRRLAYVSHLLCQHDVVTLVAAMSPYRAGREEARRLSSAFIEVFVDAPVRVCEERDPVGLYRRFRSGLIKNLSGMDEPYEEPVTPEVHCFTDSESVEESVSKVLARALSELQRPFQ